MVKEFTGQSQDLSSSDFRYMLNESQKRIIDEFNLSQKTHFWLVTRVQNLACERAKPGLGLFDKVCTVQLIINLRKSGGF